MIGGGYSEEKDRKSISSFKTEFGGQLAGIDKITVPVSIKGKLAWKIRGIIKG